MVHDKVPCHVEAIERSVNFSFGDLLPLSQVNVCYFSTVVRFQNSLFLQ